MSEPSYDQSSFCAPQTDQLMNAAASSLDNHGMDYDLGCNHSMELDLGYANDTGELLPPAMDIFESVSDSPSFGRASLSSIQPQETNCADFGVVPGLPPQDPTFDGSNFHYKDDTCGAISTEDENEEYCAELAERWVEEQIHQEDLGCVAAPENSDRDDYLYAAFSEPSSMICDRILEGYRSEPSPLKSPGGFSSSLNPINPVQPPASPSKGQLKRASKRSASEVSNTSSTQHKPGKRRNAKVLPPNASRSESRIRMDNALHERSHAQLALREALLNLKKAQQVERECRARYASATILVTKTAEKECEALLREDTPWNNMFHQLKKYKDATGGCNVKQVEDNKSPEMARLQTWIGKNRKDCKVNSKSSHVNRVSPTPSVSPDSKAGPEGANPAGSVMTCPSDPNSAIDSKGSTVAIITPDDDASVFEDLDPESILADPYKKIALDGIGFDWDPRTSRWNMMYEELKAFKAIHGNTLVPHANFGLGSWVKRQQVQYTLYSSGSKSELTEDRVRLLNDLGFVWSRRSNTWNENFQRLKRWSEEHGSCHIPDGTDDPELTSLSKWVADQRAHYKRHMAEDGATESDVGEENATKKKSKKSKLCPEKIEALKSIGFEFDARDAKWLQKLDVLIEYKKQHGDYLVPSNYREDPTLSNWVASQRQQYKLYQKGSKSHMTERRLKILTEAGFPFSSKEELQKRKEEATQQDIEEFDAKSWVEKFKDLLFHIARHGSIDSLQKHNSLLWDWVRKQREEIYRLGCDSDVGDTTTDTIEKDHVSLMKVADMFASSRASESSAESPCSSAIKDDLSWDCQFGSLATWYIKYGTYSNKGMPAKLKKFMCKQQEQHRLLHSGTKSELTPEQVEKLNDIYFPFDAANPKESSENDVAMCRRNRSWEEYRLDLAISYIQKGNYDMQAIDDQELRRWATEQKRQHKLYLSGKQSSLSFTQIQRLIDIKFISKRPKHWSWPELCGDLMAFRIQFGNFDVASAKVANSTKTSKGKPVSSSTSSTALSNIQDFVTKLTTARDEFTPEQLLKLTSASFPLDTSVDHAIVASSSCIASNSLDTAAPENQMPLKSVAKHIFGTTLEMYAKPEK